MTLEGAAADQATKPNREVVTVDNVDAGLVLGHQTAPTLAADMGAQVPEATEAAAGEGPTAEPAAEEGAEADATEAVEEWVTAEPIKAAGEATAEPAAEEGAGTQAAPLVPAAVKSLAAVQGAQEKAAAAAVAAPQEGPAEVDAAAATPEAAAESPSDEQLVGRLRALLRDADLSTVTERSLRRALEAEFGVELAAKKPLIRAEIEKFLAEQDDGEQEEEEVGAEEDEQVEEEGASRTSAKKRRRSGGAALGSRLSPELAAFLGMDTCTRPKVVSLLWVYIREHNLQDPSDKRRILLDDKLKTLFPGKSTDMFKMNKHLSKHCKVDDRDQPSEEEEDAEEEEGGGSGEGSGEEEDEPKPKRTRAAAAPKRAPPRKRKASGEGGSVARKPTGFQKPVRVSEEMAAWCGKSEISRPELTKFFYAYVKEHALHDPDNKQFVLSDATLLALTGQPRIRAFGFQSLVKQHFIKN